MIFLGFASEIPAAKETLRVEPETLAQLGEHQVLPEGRAIHLESFGYVVQMCSNNIK